MDIPPAAGTLGPVVVGTDGSVHAAAATLWAAEEAFLRGQHLAVVHAMAPAGDLTAVSDDVLRMIEDSGRAVLDAAVGQVRHRHPDLPVHPVLTRDDPADALLATADPRVTLVVGSRGLGGFAALLLGSVGLRVAARAPGPVVVVRGAAARSVTGTVLVGARDARDRPALRYAAQAARLRGAALRVLGTWALVDQVGAVAPQADDLREVARAQADATAEALRPVREEFPDLPVTEEVLRAASAAGALTHASAGADLLVLGARRTRYPLGPRLGRVAHAALHHAHCPVAVVPAG
ncbi:universal stress protein [Streptomyces sp. B1866]|uniref:universal stress protein n=1 Tax=Streptomyces sp. B1866 TaxID=3075431 RepID=UPI00288D37C2|nr:universal stress protein [Streptomyces sp. B1866]MDT3399632.1 universal stress protein [Streptomyces sp. B1866]